MTTAERDALSGTELWNWRVIANRTTGRLEQLDISSGVWRPAVDLTGFAEASHGTHGVSSVNGRGGAVGGLAEASHGTHGVSSVNGRGGAVGGLAEASHGTHGVSSVNGRSGAVSGMAEGSHGTHGVSSVNGRGGDVGGLAEASHGHAAQVVTGNYSGDGTASRSISLGVSCTVVLVAQDSGTTGKTAAVLTGFRSVGIGASSGSAVGSSEAQGTSFIVDGALNTSSTLYYYAAFA